MSYGTALEQREQDGGEIATIATPCDQLQVCGEVKSAIAGSAKLFLPDTMLDAMSTRICLLLKGNNSGRERTGFWIWGGGLGVLSEVILRIVKIQTTLPSHSRLSR